MYPAPQGALESPEQMRDLDDTFLTSDPYGYFVSRIGMLHAWAKTAEGKDQVRGAASGTPSKDSQADGIAAHVFPVGRPDLDPIIAAVMQDKEPERPKAMVVSAQVAVDAFALRHHVAEAMVRLFVACSERSIATDPLTTSLWSRMTDDKNTQIDLLVKAATNAAHDLGEFGFGRLILPPSATVESDADRAFLEHLLDRCAEWFRHALTLLQPAELDVNTAHNKVKHGLAIRGRSDLKVSFTTVEPDSDGNIPLSAFGDEVSFEIFERPVLEFMSRPKLQESKIRQGLEVTQLRLDYRALLAESTLMAYVHGALFHVAACRHFDGRSIPQGLSVAAHPGYAAQDAARPNVGGYQVGTRFPITKPPGGGEARSAGFWHQDGTSLSFKHFGKRKTGRVVDDSQGSSKDLRK